MNENARKDLKEGLLLYNTENNVGLKNAWNIIQAEVSGQAGHEEGRRGLRLRRGPGELPGGTPYSGCFWRGTVGDWGRVSRIWTRERVPKWAQGSRKDGSS